MLNRATVRSIWVSGFCFSYLFLSFILLYLYQSLSFSRLHCLKFVILKLIITCYTVWVLLIASWCMMTYRWKLVSNEELPIDNHNICWFLCYFVLFHTRIIEITYPQNHVPKHIYSALYQHIWVHRKTGLFLHFSWEPVRFKMSNYFFWEKRLQHIL